jgi:peptide-methionine (S)-S-oxide reductase
MMEFKSMHRDFQEIVDSTAAAKVNGYLGGYGSFADLSEEIGTYGLTDAAATHLMDAVRHARRTFCLRS